MNGAERKPLDIDQFGLLDKSKTTGDISPARARLCHDVVINQKGALRSLAKRLDPFHVVESIGEHSDEVDVEERTQTTASQEFEKFYNPPHKTCLVHDKSLDATLGVGYGQICASIHEYHDETDLTSTKNYIDILFYYSNKDGQSWYGPYYDDGNLGTVGVPAGLRFKRYSDLQNGDWNDIYYDFELAIDDTNLYVIHYAKGWYLTNNAPTTYTELEDVRVYKIALTGFRDSSGTPVAGAVSDPTSISASVTVLRSSEVVDLLGPYSHGNAVSIERNGTDNTYAASELTIAFVNDNAGIQKIYVDRYSSAGGAWLGSPWTITSAGTESQRPVVRYNYDDDEINVAFYRNANPTFSVYRAYGTVAEWTAGTQTERLISASASSSGSASGYGISYRIVPKLSSTDSVSHILATVHSTEVGKIYYDLGSGTVVSATFTPATPYDKFDFDLIYNTESLSWYAVTYYMQSALGTGAATDIIYRRIASIDSSSTWIIDDIDSFDTLSGVDVEWVSVNSKFYIAKTGTASPYTYTWHNGTMNISATRYEVASGNEIGALVWFEEFTNFVIEALTEVWAEEDGSLILICQGSDDKLHRIVISDDPFIPLWRDLENTFQSVYHNDTTIAAGPGGRFRNDNNVVRIASGSLNTNNPGWYGYIKREFFKNLLEVGSEFESRYAVNANLMPPERVVNASALAEITNATVTTPEDELGDLTHGSYEYNIALEYDGFQYSLPNADSIQVDLERTKIFCRAAATDDVSQAWVNINADNHGGVVGDKLSFTQGSIFAEYGEMEIVSVPDANNFVFALPEGVPYPDNDETYSGTVAGGIGAKAAIIKKKIVPQSRCHNVSDNQAGLEVADGQASVFSYPSGDLENPDDYSACWLWGTSLFNDIDDGEARIVEVASVTGNTVNVYQFPATVQYDGTERIGRAIAGNNLTVSSQVSTGMDVLVKIPVSDNTEIEIGDVDNPTKVTISGTTYYDGTHEVVRKGTDATGDFVIIKVDGLPIAFTGDLHATATLDDLKIGLEAIDGNNYFNAGQGIRSDNGNFPAGAVTIVSIAVAPGTSLVMSGAGGGESADADIEAHYYGDETLATTDYLKINKSSNSKSAVGIRVKVKSDGDGPNNKRISGVVLIGRYKEDELLSDWNDWEVLGVAPIEDGENRTWFSGECEWDAKSGALTTGVLSIGSGTPELNFTGDSQTVFDEYSFIRVYDTDDEEHKYGRVRDLAADGSTLTVDFGTTAYKPISDPFIKYEVLGRWHTITSDGYHLFVHRRNVSLEGSFRTFAGFSVDLDTIEGNYRDRCMVNKRTFFIGVNTLTKTAADAIDDEELLDNEVFFTPQSGIGLYSEDAIVTADFLKFGRDGDNPVRILSHGIGSDAAGTGATEVLAIFKHASIYLVDVSDTNPGAWTQLKKFSGKGAISRNSVIRVGSRIYFLDRDGLKFLEGMTIQAVKSYERIEGDISDFNDVEYRGAVLGYDGESDFLFLSFPDRTTSTDVDTRVFHYDVTNDEWGPFRLDEYMTVVNETPAVGIGAYLPDGLKNITGKLFYSDGADTKLYPGTAKTSTPQWIGAMGAASKPLVQALVKGIYAAHRTVGAAGSIIVRDQDGTTRDTLTLGAAAAANHTVKAGHPILNLRVDSFEVEWNADEDASDALLDALFIDYDEILSLGR